MKKSYNFDEVDTLKKKLDALRPLDAQVYKKIRHKLSLEWNYNSNAIEGNTLSLSETKFFLEVGLTSKGKPLSEYLEIKNHQHAINYLYESLKESNGKPILSERFIKDMHAMLFERNETYKIEDENGKTVHVNVLPGKYKQQNNYVLLPDGSRKNYIDSFQTPGAMQALVEFYQKKFASMHPIELAAEIHTQFVAIHPFVDGNGRVARILMNLILMQAGYQPAVIQNELKQDYYEALRHYDETKNLDLFMSILEQESIRTLQITLNAAQGKSILDTEDITKRTQNFSQRMSALDKDIGTITKKVTREEKERSIKNIRDYFANLAEKKLTEIKSDLFHFEVKNTTTEEVGFYLMQSLDEMLQAKNIFCELEKKHFANSKRKTRSRQIIGVAGVSKYEDYLKKEGSGFKITLNSRRLFIPSTICDFVIIPTKYTLCICSILSSTELNDKKDEIVTEPVISFVQNGVIWEDWNTGDLDTFFNETFEHFLDQVETESEKRRLRFAEDE